MRRLPLAAALPAALTVALLAASSPPGAVVFRGADAPATSVAFVHGAGGGAAARAVAAAGVEAVARFPAVDSVAVRATPAALAALARRPGIVRVEPDRPVAYHLPTSVVATGGDAARRTQRDVTGAPLDGRGVSVAVIDSGVDGTHPAFRRADGTSAVVRNLRNVCGGAAPTRPGVDTDFCFVDAPGNDSDTPAAGGHGTHVAGIVAARDTTTTGSAPVRVRGQAPGTSLVALGVGQGPTILGTALALNWVLRNHRAPCGAGVPAERCPPIRVTNNSYGPASSTPFDPEDIQVRLQRALLAEGVLSVYAAGNDGVTQGDSTTPSPAATTNPFGQDPTPGILQVAAYDDLQTGSRDGRLAAFSSRGDPADPRTWPDVSAPGVRVLSTCRPDLPLCAGTGTRNGPGPTDVGTFTELSGTSMAAPHVAGAIAQLLQAQPRLTPADVELLLEDTATPFGATPIAAEDPLNPATPSSSDRGHGLIDVAAAVEAATARTAAAPALTVSLTTGTPVVTAGNRPVLAGRLLDGDRAVPGAGITLFAKEYATTSYVPVATTTTDGGGGFRFPVTPRTQTAYVARAEGGASRAVLVRVHVRMTVTSPTAGTAVPSTTTFTGRLAPAYASAPVGVAVLRDGRFIVLAQRPTDGSGAFSVPARLPRGTQVAVVFTSARSGTLNGARSLTLSVR